MASTNLLTAILLVEMVVFPAATEGVYASHRSHHQCCT